MASLVFNIAKGRVVELAKRVDENDPSASAFIVIPCDANGTADATVRDFATVAAALAGGVVERSATGWGRKTVTDAEMSAPTVDNANDRFPIGIPDQTWTGVTAGNVTDLLVAYDANTGSGTDADLVPLVFLDWEFSPSGTATDYTARLATIFRAE